MPSHDHIHSLGLLLSLQQIHMCIFSHIMVETTSKQGLPGCILAAYLLKAVGNHNTLRNTITMIASRVVLWVTVIRLELRELLKENRL